MKKLRTSLQADLHNGSPNCSDLLFPGLHSENATSAQKDVFLPSPWNGYIPGTCFLFCCRILCYINHFDQIFSDSSFCSFYLKKAGHGSLWDFAESVRSGKVLQGQENLGLVSPLYGRDKINRQLDFEMHPIAAHHNNIVLNRMEKSNYSELGRIQPSASFSGSLETNSFPRVLQGQEICSLKSLTRKTELNPGAWRKPEFSCNVFNVNQRLAPNCYPLASEGIRNMVLPFSGVYKTGQDPVMLSYMSNFQRDNHVLNTNSVRDGLSRDEKRILPVANDQKTLEKTSLFPISGMPLKDKNDENSKGAGGACKIFGFSLTEEPPNSTSQGSNRRSCTKVGFGNILILFVFSVSFILLLFKRTKTCDSSVKVHKQGSLVGRAIDLSRLYSYDDLMIELERLFSMEGLLRDPSKGWRVLYTDSENDMMVVGDDPWQ